MKILYVLNNNMQYAGTESVVLSYFKYLQSEKIHIDFILHTTEEESNNNEICRYLRQSGSKIHCVIPRKVSLKQNIKENVSKQTRKQPTPNHTVLRRPDFFF